MIRLTDMRRVRGRYKLVLPIEEVRDWEVGQLVEARTRRGDTVQLQLVDWYPTEEGTHNEWRGRDEWVYWFVQATQIERPRLLVPAGRPTEWGPESDVGYTDQRCKAMWDEPEAVGEEWQQRISEGASWADLQRREEAQQRREKEPFALRVLQAKEQVRAVSAGRLTRAELRTVEILGNGDRKRALALLSRLEKRLFR